MRKILAVALLAALAPLGIAHAATPKPMATMMPMKGKMGKMPMKGKMSMKGKKSKMAMKGKMSMKPKTLPMRDPKTGRFMKKPTPAPTVKK